MAEPQHAPFGGSTAARTWHCPGWRALADTLPPSGSSSFADRGTLLHMAMERILSDDIEPESVIGMFYEGIKLTEDLYHQKIMPALNAVNEVMDLYGIEEWVCEERVTLSEEAWGTCDLLGRGEVWALVLDFKFGDGVIVSPVENHQFLFYGAGAYHTADTADIFDDIDKVVFAVVQPSNHAEDDYQVWETTTERLRDYRKPFLEKVEIAKSAEAPTCAGDHCKFCPAAPICPEKSGAAQRALLMEPVDLETLQEALNLAEELEDWIAAVRQKAHEQMEHGVSIRGWKLVMKRATRVWKDAGAAQKYLTRKLGGKKNVVKETLVSPAQAETLAKKQKVDLSLEPLVEKKSSGTTLARADDKRPAVLGVGAAQSALATIQ